MGTAVGLGGKDSADVPLAQFQTPPCDDAFALLEYQLGWTGNLHLKAVEYVRHRRKKPARWPAWKDSTG